LQPDEEEIIEEIIEIEESDENQSKEKRSRNSDYDGPNPHHDY